MNPDRPSKRPKNTPSKTSWLAFEVELPSHLHLPLPALLFLWAKEEPREGLSLHLHPFDLCLSAIYPPDRAIFTLSEPTPSWIDLSIESTAIGKAHDEWIYGPRLWILHTAFDSSQETTYLSLWERAIAGLLCLKPSDAS
ncbi:MAG: hypothetical protein NZM37_00180 [Sandaracinaceae bacterium]|nr:hypothetical protein [Sandaracinaceae bacterium]MDW8247113.1 hypothetical protein [Sandaracinaceae bacterium]